MRIIKTLFLLPVVLITAFTVADNNFWKVKLKEAKINFVLPSEPHKLSFSGLDATINFNKGSLTTSEIIARIDVKSLTTEDEGLTKHLLTADFLDAEKFPAIKFISSRINKTDTGFVAYGALTMKDSAHVVMLPFTFTEKGKEGLFKGWFEIYSGDYGVMKKSKTGKDKIRVTLEIPVIRSK